MGAVGAVTVIVAAAAAVPPAAVAVVAEEDAGAEAASGAVAREGLEDGGWKVGCTEVLWLSPFTGVGAFSSMSAAS